MGTSLLAFKLESRQDYRSDWIEAMMTSISELLVLLLTASCLASPSPMGFSDFIPRGGLMASNPSGFFYDKIFDKISRCIQDVQQDVSTYGMPLDNLDGLVSTRGTNRRRIPFQAMRG